MKDTESNYDKMFDKEMDMYERVAAFVYTMFNDYFLVSLFIIIMNNKKRMCS